jgi:hypothetical protein
MTDEKREKREFDRRTFIGAVAVVGAGAALAVREYISKQEQEDKRVDQLGLW